MSIYQSYSRYDIIPEIKWICKEAKRSITVLYKYMKSQMNYVYTKQIYLEFLFT